MLTKLLGSKLRTDILLLMLKSGPVYCFEIQQLFERNLYAVQNQLGKLRDLGVLHVFCAHMRYYYDLDPKYYLHAELQALLEKHFQSLPRQKQIGYYMTPDFTKRKNLLFW